MRILVCHCGVRVGWHLVQNALMRQWYLTSYASRIIEKSAAPISTHSDDRSYLNQTLKTFSRYTWGKTKQLFATRLLSALIRQESPSVVKLPFGEVGGCCHSTPAKPAVNPYQQRRHPNAQNKLRLYIPSKFYIKNFRVQFRLSYIYTDPYFKWITLLNWSRLGRNLTEQANILTWKVLFCFYSFYSIT